MTVSGRRLPAAVVGRIKRSSFIGVPHYLRTLAEMVPRYFHEGPSVWRLSRR